VSLKGVDYDGTVAGYLRSRCFSSVKDQNQEWEEVVFLIMLEE